MSQQHELSDPEDHATGGNGADWYHQLVTRQPACPFCNLPAERILIESENAIAFLDGFPVADGHALVIPKQHAASLFDLPVEVQVEIWRQVADVRRLLLERYGPDAFNVGINDGAAAGQTVQHAHIHVIPRRNGDVPDPRGGIRWVIPAKAKYW